MEVRFYNFGQMIDSFIDKYIFDIVYREPVFPLNRDSSVDLPALNSLDVLLSAAVTGNKVVAFYNRVPVFRKMKMVKVPFILITRRLPEKLEIPTIFVKESEKLADTLALAYRLSSDAKLPVNVVVAPTVINNISSTMEFDPEHTVVKPFIVESDLKKLSKERLIEIYQLCDAYLSKHFKGVEIDKKLSFTDCELNFIPYLVPHIHGDIIKKIEKVEHLEIAKDDYCFWEELIYQFKLSVSLNVFERDVEKKNFYKYICPGCPFVMLKRVFKDDMFIFSDLNCDIIYGKFGINKLSFSEYYGLTLQPLQKETLFIGNYSSMNHNLLYQLKSHQKVIVLDDGVMEICADLPRLRNFKKMMSGNFIFPYSCENIPQSKVLTVKDKKCVCAQKGEDLKCISSTCCPALFVKDKKVDINSSLCNGCEFCKIYCPYGAIK